MHCLARPARSLVDRPRAIFAGQREYQGIPYAVRTVVLAYVPLLTSIGSARKSARINVG
jgi:hypothetical protein